MLSWIRARRWDLAVLAGILCVFNPLLRGEVIWLRDLARWVAPSRHALREALSRGEIPRWDHLQGVGVPLLANPLHGVFYPLTPVSLIEPIARWSSVFLLLHVALGALGFARWSRSLGASPEGSAVTALAWSLSGPTLSEWTAGFRLPSLSWTPWIALGLGAVVSNPSRRAVGAFALPLGLALLAGEPFMVLLALLLSALTLPANDSFSGLFRDRHRALRALALALVGAALGALVAGASLSPVLAAMSGTQRAANLSDADALGWSLPAIRLIDQLVAGGVSLSALLDNDPAARAITGPIPLLYWHYLGASVLALALCSLRRDRKTVTLAAALIVATLLAMGSHTPLYGLAQWLIPPLRRMRSPEKFLALSAMVTALLAGRGYDALRGDPRRAVRAALVGVALAMILAMPFASHSLTRRVHESAWRALAGLSGLVFVALAAWRAPRAAPWIALSTVVLDLSRLAATVPLWTPLDEALWRSPVAEAARGLAGPVAPPRLYRAHTLGEARFQPLELEGARRRFANLPPNTNRPLGFGMVPAYDVAAAPGLDALLSLRRTDVLALLSVDAALQPARERAGPRAGLSPLPQAFRTIELLSVDARLPRVYAVSQTRVEPASTPDARTLQPEVLRGERALVPAGVSLLDAAPARAGRCELRRVRNGRIDADCVLDREAHVVFVEQFAPGWSASVDGRGAAVTRTNGLLLGVRVAAGRHHVALRYEPPGMRLGLALGALALGALALLSRRTGCAPARDVHEGEARSV